MSLQTSWHLLIKLPLIKQQQSNEQSNENKIFGWCTAYLFATSFTLVIASNLHQLFPNQLQNTQIYLVTSGYQGALASIGLCECSFSD